MTFGRSFLFLALCGLFGLGNSGLGRTKDIVHIISVGLSLVPLEVLLFSQIEGFWGEVFFDL
jgi:hypothetical protein